MITIIVDSTSDINEEISKEYDITVLPITVDINGVTYQDRVNLTPTEFYNQIKGKNVFAKTSQVTPSAFEEVFSREINKGNKVICLTLSSKLSGTFNSANIAKNTLESDDIYIIDSKTASFGLGLLAIESAKMAKKGCGVDEILTRINNLIDNQTAVGYIDSLDALCKNGRISASSAMVGGMLGIKPILTLNDGKIEVAGKTRGQKAALKQVLAQLSKENIDEEIGLYIGYSNDDDVLTSSLLNNLSKDMPALKTQIGPGVGAHLGLGSLLVFYVTK